MPFSSLCRKQAFCFKSGGDWLYDAILSAPAVLSVDLSATGCV